LSAATVDKTAAGNQATGSNKTVDGQEKQL
jgi:hypothetical protein